MPLHQHETPEELQRALGWNREVSNDPAERENLRSYIIAATVGRWSDAA